MAQNGAAPASIHAFPQALQGADLQYSFINEQDIEMELRLYYTCDGYKPENQQPILITEGYSKKEYARIQLSLVSQFDSLLLVPVSCGSIGSPCVKVAIYRGVQNLLIPQMGGYGIHWSYVGWDQSRLKNIQGFNDFAYQGLTISANIADLPVGQKNNSPIFYEPPLISICRNQPILLNHRVFDKDGDSVVFSWGEPYDYPSKSQIPNPEEPKLLPGEQVHRSFLAGRPPYKAITYVKGFTYLKPLGKSKAHLNTQNGEVEVKAEESGDYLMDVQVSEYRKGQLIGVTHRIIKLNVKE